MELTLAPFQGVTHKIYRNAFGRHFPGMDRAFAPFISGVNPQKINLSKFRDVLPADENTIPLVPQFVSINASEIVEIAAVLSSYGYSHINWNMGCPFSRLANKMRGCGILPYPNKIREMMDQIFSRTETDISVKTRLGYRSPDELFKVMEVFNDYPIKEIIIHPRTGIQRYKGATRRDLFEQLIGLAKAPVTYNGDIFHHSKYTQLQKQFPGIRSWMLGRGALINPFLSSQIKQLSLSDNHKREAVKAFHQELFEAIHQKTSNKNKLLGQMKAVWYYMSGMFSGGTQYFHRLKVCDDIQSYVNFADELTALPLASDDEIENHWKTGLKHI